MSLAERKYDFIIFGATGYTGQYVMEEVARVSKEMGGHLTYAIAGRNKSKLVASLDYASKNTGYDLSQINSIVADVKDPESISEMAKKCRIVINCVGPYRFHGEEVVTACIEAGTDHIDISGEPQYLEGVHLRHNERAIEKGVHVVGACGFDSVPADMGVLYLQNQFPGDVNSIEMIVGMDPESKGSAPVNVGTLESALYGYHHRGELSQLRRELYKQKLPKSNFKHKPKGGLWYSDIAKKWCLPNMASDRSVVMRTQYINHQLVNKRPIQLNAYFGLDTLMISIGAMVFGLMFATLASFNWTRNLAVKYPHIFTFGIFTKEGAKREDLKNLKFCLTFVGHGWDNTIVDTQEQHSDEPNLKKVLKVRGPDPGYFGTSAIMVACAVTMLKEKDRLPLTGGIYTPGSAFLKTTLIDRLEKKGISFEMVSEEGNQDTK